MKALFRNHHHLIGASLLIAGTSIGVGMLGLPVATAEVGYFASFPAYFAVWLFVLGTSRLIVEACLWCPKGSNLITISRELLGTKGAVVCWCLYLFLFYCLMVAHTVAGGGVVSLFQGGTLPIPVSTLIYVLVFSPVIYFGTKWVDRLNILLMTGVILTFLLFLVDGFPRIQFDLLLRSDFSKIPQTLPLFLTALGFQNLIPTIVAYTDRNIKLINRAIWIGSSIPLALYLVWQLLIHGIVPFDILQNALANGQNAVVPLEEALQNSSIVSIGRAFAFFAMTTSFLGIGIAFFDFWADGLGWKKKGPRKLLLMGLVFGIPYAIATIYPKIFFAALNWAGGIGVVLLFGILPILFVWSGRYLQKRSKEHPELKGGKITLGILFLFCIFVMIQMAS